MAYSGTFLPKNIKKYEGDHTKIVWRSLWERGFFVWCDENPAIVKWSSEETIIPYICKTDNRPHRYFIDAKIVFESGQTILVEIKPESQIKKPNVAGKKVTRALLESIATYAKNTSKWEAADAYCKARGWSFQIWGESVLAKLGIKTNQQVKRSMR